MIVCIDDFPLRLWAIVLTFLTSILKKWIDPLSLLTVLKVFLCFLSKKVIVKKKLNKLAKKPKKQSN